MGSFFLYSVLFKSTKTKIAETAETANKPVVQKVPEETGLTPVMGGNVVIQDFRGGEVGRLETAVFGGNWVAVPVWALLGGENLVFQGSDSTVIRIVGAFWAENDPLVLWKLDLKTKLQTLEISPWKQSAPLEWHSLRPDRSSLQVEVHSPERKGSFLGFAVPETVRGTGFFMQEGRVVGWTFVEMTERGYLWAGPAEAGLSPKIRVSEFYASLFSNSREAHFSRVLAMGEGTPAADRLKAFASGVLRTPLLASEDLPSQLRTQSIVARMHTLASELIQNGFAEEVARILDSNVLMELSDPVLVNDAAAAVAKFQDFSRAVQYLEKLKRSIYALKGRSFPEIDQFQAQLYKDWLRKTIESGGYSGTVIFEEARRAFPNDVELHLLGVEAALTEKNWKKAKELLQARNYPLSQKEWANKLESRVKEQEEHEAITIRFNPGEQLIPVDAYLNGSHLQKFIIDTGANITSIPSSAVKALNLEIDESTSVRLVQSIEGVRTAYEVLLDSVEISGYRVDNLSALVIDLPGYTDYGLLGLNFLNNFRFEIDKNKGILRLRKREIR